jgi:hypothetical protein
VLTRRNILTSLGATLITAPAIVRAGNIMRVRPIVLGMLTFGPFPYEPRIMGLLIYDIEKQGFVPFGQTGQLLTYGSRNG